MIALRNSSPKSTCAASVGAPPQRPPVTPPSSIGDDRGDVLYGARAIALFLFGSEDSRARRRVFNLWAHYQHRKEKVGLFKLKGALCLSKSQWRAFQG